MQKLPPEKAFSFMDWVSNNLIDFTPKKFGLTIDMSWGFVVAFGVFVFFLILLRVKRGKRST
jgi:hypothetical protein